MNPHALNAERQTLNVLLAGFEETFELANAGGMAHFSERFGFDLTDPFAGDTKLPAHFLEGPAVTVHEAETLFENLPFTLG
jgi:hypothetical protein